MQLSAAEKEEIRARLASRKSFLGGSLTTTKASISDAYIPASQLPPPAEPRPKLAKSKAPAAGGRLPGQRADLPPPVKPKVQANYACFDDLRSDTPPPAKEPTKLPTPVANRGLLSPAPTSSGQPRRAVSAPPPQVKRGTPTPQHRAPTPPAQAVRGTPPHNANGRNVQRTQAASGLRKSTPPLTRSSPPRRPSSSHGQVVRSVKASPGKAKKGQAGRSQAFAPQALGGPTRSQKANQAWASASAQMRNPANSSSGGRAPSALINGAKPRPSAGLSNGKPACVSARLSPALPASKSISLAGKDLSKLPDWQRQILEKKYKAGMKRRREMEEDDSRISDSETDDDFVVDDDALDWRNELKSITGYDPSKFGKEDLDDRSMEAGWRAIQAEEKRSARLGRGEDEKAEQEELARQKAKAAAKAAAKKKARLGGSQAL